ncbi:MAG: hypothetical protein JRN20_22400, partial [Nitrososphaerota archaeon]|nr:hypothetical protein [Nitrososphaerota archaeon]
LNPISRWFWKRAVRREILFFARPLAWVSGLLFIVSGITGVTSLILGLVIGRGVIVLAGQLKHRILSITVLAAGLIIFYTLGGATVRWGAILVMLASILGIASTFF